MIKSYACPVGYVRTALTVLALVAFASCGEDRTYEYEEKTEQSHWVQDEMAEKYLWGDSIKDMQWKEYFGSPIDFVKKLITQCKASDPWTYCTIDTLENNEFERGMFNHNNSYGLDLVLMTDPTGETTKQYARVVTVYPDSPASECGIERGDFISLIDGEKVTTKTIEGLRKGLQRKIVVNRLDTNPVDGLLFWESIDSVTLPASAKVPDEQVWVSKMVSEDMAYLMLTNLQDGHSKDALYSLLAHDPQKVVIDLRLCNHGSLEEVCELASLLNDSVGVFIQTIFNARRSADNHSYSFSHANAPRFVYFITGTYTKGAAEWLIHGLKAMNSHDKVITFGTKTAGQNVWLEQVKPPYSFTLNMAAAYVADAYGNYDYASGIKPDGEINELEFAKLSDYGDADETLLYVISTKF